VTISTEDILKLSVAERLRLIGELWDSIEASTEAIPLTEAQREELDRRIDAFERDPSDTLSWEAVRISLEQDE